MHKLLERQLRRHFGGLEAVPAELGPFLDAVGATYAEADDDRRFVERSLELTSQELMQRNNDLRAKQHEQQVIFDAVPALIIYKDADNRILRLNESAARSLGGKASELEGRRTEDVLPAEVARRLHEDDLEVIRTGRPKLGVIETHPTADGLQHWMRTDKVPYQDEAGRVAGVIVFSVDITERKEAESRLRESEERYRLIVETATEGIWTLDGEARTTFANAVMAEMLGYTREEMLGRPVFDFMHAPEVALMREKLADLAGGGRVAVDFRFRRRDGSDLWAQVSAAPMLGPSGQIVGTLGMMTNVTERKAAEEKLRQAYARLQKVDQERMQFLNNAAHELATPLTPIKLQMRLLRLRPRGAGDGSDSKAVDVLDRNFDRLARLVKDLLDSARLQAASLKLHPQGTDLREVVYESVETYLPAAQDAGVTLEVDAEASPLPVQADRSRIGQVMDNLLSNAVKFTPRGGTVRVDLAERGGRAIVRVRDTGAGMRPEDLGRLFRPFSQVHDTMQRTRGGTGLGLYVSRGIIEAHGGSIHAESAGLGTGSLFWFDLPLGGPAGGPIGGSGAGNLLTLAAA